MAPKSKVFEGAILENIHGEKFRIVRLVDTKYVGKTNKKLKYFEIEFIDSGYRNILEASTINKGEVRDKSQKDILGVASFGSAEMNPLHCNKFYRLYNDMIRRCYDKNCSEYNRYGGLGVKVSEEWLCYDTFLNDIQTLEGFDKEKLLKAEIVLDKDKKQLSIPNEKRIYSKETCVFISPTENSIIANKNREVGRTKIATNLNTGEIFRFKNLSKFCREHKLTYNDALNSLRRTVNKKTKDNWKFEYEA